MGWSPRICLEKNISLYLNLPKYIWRKSILFFMYRIFIGVNSLLQVYNEESFFRTFYCYFFIVTCWASFTHYWILFTVSRAVNPDFSGEKKKGFFLRNLVWSSIWWLFWQELEGLEDLSAMSFFFLFFFLLWISAMSFSCIKLQTCRNIWLAWNSNSSSNIFLVSFL